MKNVFFNSYEFDRVYNDSYGDFEEANDKYLEYLSKYPCDYCTHLFYIQFLIMNSKLERANNLFIELSDKVNSDVEFLKNRKKMGLFNRNYVFCKIKLLSYMHRYDELIDYYNNDEQNVLENISNVEPLIVFCNKRLGHSFDCVRNENFYLTRQIIEYQESDFLHHIKKHLTDQTNSMEIDGVRFVENFPINDVIDYFKSNFDCFKKINYGLFENVYFFKLDGCGKVDYKFTDYFEVVCFDCSKEMITIYPCFNEKRMPYVDLNGIIDIKSSNDGKIRRLSQVDKFNARFGKK